MQEPDRYVPSPVQQLEVADWLFKLPYGDRLFIFIVRNRTEYDAIQLANGKCKLMLGEGPTHINWKWEYYKLTEPIEMLVFGEGKKNA